MPGAYPRDLACPAALPVAANPRIGHSTQLDNHLCKRHALLPEPPVARTLKKKPMPQRHRFLEPIHNVKEERLRSKSAADGRENRVFNPGNSVSLGPPSLFELRRAAFAPASGWLAAVAAGEGWWSQSGSNRRPQACKASALPTELWPRTRGTRQAIHEEGLLHWWAE